MDGAINQLKDGKTPSEFSSPSVDVMQAASDRPRRDPAMRSNAAGKGTLQTEAALRAVAVVVIRRWVRDFQVQ